MQSAALGQLRLTAPAGKAAALGVCYDVAANGSAATAAHLGCIYGARLDPTARGDALDQHAHGCTIFLRSRAVAFATLGCTGAASASVRTPPYM